MTKVVTVDIDMAQYKDLGPSMPEIRRRGLERIAQDTQKTVDKLSPIDEGVLHKWFIHKLTDDEAVIKSPAHYVGPVNYGHSQRPGRFIPGTWKKGKFRYDPKAEGGMVLKRSFVPGQHFIERSIEDVKPRIDEHFKVVISEVLE